MDDRAIGGATGDGATGDGGEPTISTSAACGRCAHSPAAARYTWFGVPYGSSTRARARASAGSASSRAAIAAAGGTGSLTLGAPITIAQRSASNGMARTASAGSARCAGRSHNPASMTSATQPPPSANVAGPHGLVSTRGTGLTQSSGQGARLAVYCISRANGRQRGSPASSTATTACCPPGANSGRPVRTRAGWCSIVVRTAPGRPSTSGCCPYGVSTPCSTARVGTADSARLSSSQRSPDSSGCDTMIAGAPGSTGTEKTRSVTL